VKKASIEAKPTFNYQEAVETFDRKYKYSQPVAGGTNISAGIDQGITILTSGRARPYAFKTMIVMTDGQHNTGRDPWLAAEDAAKKGIQIHTVTFSHQADQVSMKRTAKAGKGVHFHAPDGDALEAIFREIAKMPAAAIIE
jgi:Mg-chelatase subunit ChlD